MRFSRDWDGDTALVIGGGPSVSRLGQDKLIPKCRGRMKVIAVNRAYRLAPWADMLYGADADFWDREGVEGVSERELGKQPGSHSGFHAWRIAIERGASVILLAGIDLRTYEPGQRFHWHEGYGLKMQDTYWQWRHEFSRAASEAKEQGVRTYNLNPASAVRCFPFARLEDWLDEA